MLEVSDSDEVTSIAKEEFKPYSCTIRVPCVSEASSTLLKQVLEVDKEISPAKVSKTMTVEGNHLVVVLETTEIRLLRASLASFFDMVCPSGFSSLFAFIIVILASLTFFLKRFRQWWPFVFSANSIIYIENMYSRLFQKF